MNACRMLSFWAARRKLHPRNGIVNGKMKQKGLVALYMPKVTDLKPYSEQ